MTREGSLFARALPITVWMFATNCEVLREGGSRTDGHAENGHGEGGYAFFALRSCHHILHGDNGEFFSPDYLCSSPPLWCNWTIEVDSGKRIHLQLEDFTPIDACQVKNDQIHLDESPGSGSHRVLERCWGRAVYTTGSNILHVVLLIGKDPRTPYRGFHGRYQSLPPSNVKEPSNKGKYRDTNEDKLPVDLLDKDKMLTNPLVTALPLTLSLEHDLTGLPTSETTKGTQMTSEVKVFSSQSTNAKNVEVRNTVGSVAMWNPEETWNDFENSLGSLGNFDNNHVSNLVTENLPNENETLDARHTVSVVLPANEQRSMSEDGSSGVQHSQSKPPQWIWSPGDLRNVGKGSWSPRTLDNEWDDQLPFEFSMDHRTLTPVQPVVEPEPPGENEMVKTSVTKHTSWHAKTNEEPVKELPISRRYLQHNTSQLVHLPGDYLFEVAVEVHANVGKVHNWEHFVTSLKMSVEMMIQDELGFDHFKGISFERVKKLHGGVLLILWLQFAESFEGDQIYETLSTALKRLLRKVVKLGSNKRFNTTFVASVSTEDVNECRTQLVLCDIHADCINHFGSYMCHCKPGFRMSSSLHSRGVICVDVEGSAQAVSPILLQGLYALCFLLGLFLLLLLCIMAVMYRRHHHGVFLVPCQRDGCGDNDSDDKNANSGSHTTRPPPPVPRPEDCWGSGRDSFPSAGPPLLKFSRLMPSDGTTSKQQEEGVEL